VSSLESPEAALSLGECIEAEESLALLRNESCPEPPLLIPDWVVNHNAPAGPEFHQELEASLRALRHARAPVERRLGMGLRVFRDRRFDTMDLCERNLASLAYNHLEISRTEAYELARLADGLECFPVMEEAFHAGDLSRSHVIALLQVMEGDTERGWGGPNGPSEARDWSTLQWSVRRWGCYVSWQVLETLCAEEDPDDKVRVPVLAPGRVWQFLKNVGKGLVEKVNGHTLPMWRVMETLCAEASSELGDLMPGKETWSVRDPHPSGAGTPEGPRRAAMAVEVPEEEALREAGGRQGEDWLEFGPDEEAQALLDSLPDPYTALTAVEMLDLLLVLMAFKRSLDWQMGRILAYGRGFAQLFDPQQALGISEKWERDLRNLDVRLEERPALREAYRTGRIGWAKAWQLTRICDGETEEAWLEHAGKLTVRGLVAEVWWPRWRRWRTCGS